MREEYLQDQVWSTSSIHSTRKLLRVFEKYLQLNDIQSIQDIVSQDIEQWLLMIQRTYAQSSINKWKYIIHDYLDWHVQKGLLLSNPFLSEWVQGKRVSSIVRVPSQEKVLQQLSKPVKTWFPNRDQAIVELFYSTGIRLGELLRLNLDDVVIDELRICGKGGKERIVPIGQRARLILIKYIQTERKEVAEKFEHALQGLFLSFKTGERLKQSAIQGICRKYGFHPHELRHCCALHMLRNGASSVVIQKLLGHSRLETVQIYTQLEKRDVMNLIDNFNPLEELGE